MRGQRNFKFPQDENFHFSSQVSTISQMNKMEKIASHIFVLFFIPVYFPNNLLYDFCVKKITQNIQHYHIFCTKPGSRITTKYFSVSCVVIHGLLHEFWMQYFLFIITFVICVVCLKSKCTDFPMDELVM